MTLDWKTLHRALLDHAKEIARLEHEGGRLLLLGLRAGVHVHNGYATFAEYCERVLGLKPRDVEEKLRVAEALDFLPAMSAALRQGDLHWSAIRELTRVAEPKTERAWIEGARGKTIRDVEKMVSGREKGDLPDTPAKDELRRRVLRFEVMGATYAVLHDAMAQIRREAGERLSDDEVLMIMARNTLGGDQKAGQSSYKLELYVCESCAKGHTRGVEVEEQTVEMAVCDEIPAATRRQVVGRHGGQCAVPGCRSRNHLDVHHVIPRSEGGTHDPDTLALLCYGHHKRHHDGYLIIDGQQSTGFNFRHADGTPFGVCQNPEQQEAFSDAQSALKNMGMKETEARKLLDFVRPHVGAETRVEEILRIALQNYRRTA